MDRPVGKLDYVDDARGIAILLVILVHANQPVEGMSAIAHSLATYGQTGVQLFFVASAFTLCLTYGRRGNEPHPYACFLLRRLFRIAPLYYLGVALYFGLHWLDRSAQPYTPLNLLANLAFVHGFVPSANNSVVPGGWSIGTEMAFYVCFPTLFSLFAHLWRRGGDAWLIGATSTAIALSVVAQWWLHERLGADIGNNSFVFYNLLNQLPVFLLGLCFFFLRHGLRRPSTGGLLAGFALSTSMAFALWHSDLVVAFALIPVVVGASFVCLLALLERLPMRGSWLQSIGQMSYSMYIFHFVICWYALDAIKALAPIGTAPETVWIAGFVLVTATSYAVARISQPLIEARGIEWGRRLIAAIDWSKRPTPIGA